MLLHIDRMISMFFLWPLLSSAKQVVMGDVKVPVELGVMSRCPDALFCESIFNDVIPQVAGKIDLSLLYIAKLTPTEPEFGVTCMHGSYECAGNVQQLCVAKYAPSRWWKFVMCQNEVGNIGRLETALECAARVGIRWDESGTGGCVGSNEGASMLRKSVRASQELGIQKSCTILINKRQVCVHDGDWKLCKNGHKTRDFVKQIDQEYERLNKGRRVDYH